LFLSLICFELSQSANLNIESTKPARRKRSSLRSHFRAAWNLATRSSRGFARFHFVCSHEIARTHWAIDMLRNTERGNRGRSCHGWRREVAYWKALWESKYFALRRCLGHRAEVSVRTDGIWTLKNWILKCPVERIHSYLEMFGVAREFLMKNECW